MEKFIFLFKMENLTVKYLGWYGLRGVYMAMRYTNNVSRSDAET
jgi:hypothetical protein